MRRWWLLLLVVPVLAGCMPPHDSYSAQAGLPRGVVIPVHTDQPGDPALEQAMAWWNGLAGRTLFAVATDNNWDGVWIYHNGWCNTRACTQPADLNGTDQNPGDYVGPYKWCDTYLQPGEGAWNVVAHELGHCLGFHHVTDRTSIMGPSNADPSNPAGDQQMLQAGGY